MMHEGARIEHLRVKAHGRRGIPMVQSAIEDAFRTELSAAGPAVRRGLLVIRHIDFGPIGSRQDQLAIKRRLAAILRDAARHAVIPPENGEVQQEAVLFPDPLDPHLAVFRAMARDKPVPRSWPYRAVLGETLFARPERIFEAIVTGQLAMAQAGPALRRLLPELGAQLPAYLRRLPAATAAAILWALTNGAAGLGRVAHPSTLPKLEALASDLALVLRDPVSALSMTSARPADLPDHQTLAILFALALSECGRAASPERVAAVTDLVRYWAEAGRSSTFPPLPLARLAAHLGAMAARPASPDAPADARTGATTLEALIAKVVADASVEPAPGSGTARPASMPSRQADAERPARAQSQAEIAADPEPAPITGFEPTRHAGIGYAIALIERVFGSWLNRPEHLAQATGQMLLRRMLERLDPHVEDPALCFLDALGEAPESADTPCAFQLLPSMLLDTAQAIRIHPVTGHPGWRVAMQGRLILAAWHGRAGPATRSLLAGRHRVERGSPRAFSQEAMLASCELGLRRLLRNGPHLRIAQLLRRHGTLAHSPTHLDIAFDAGVIDLTIRRWALDVSPGWCAWLWRVVTIHYDFGEQDGD
ncbi:type IV pilus assembly protein FimV [Parerythrobacter aestuarii]|uniref:hypothetical protein n=1 Tax=Parerythrobacter aestuarii TaxID=3020909 RepID=UPI0024DEBED4|nr:hypothetical protein [Parerythrobacter aestuarii]